MDLRKQGLKSNRKLIKSNTQGALHRKNIIKRQSLPTIEERKAGGINGFIKMKKKIDPLKAQIDFLWSGYVHNQDPGVPREHRSSKQGNELSPYERVQLQNIRKDFVGKVGKHRLNPITHKEFYYKTSRRHDFDKPLEEFMTTLENRKHPKFEDVSSDDNEPPVLDKNAPKTKAEYSNFMYHDSDSQFGIENRYLSEMKEIGRNIKPSEYAATTSGRSPKTTVINNQIKLKSSLLSVFPSYSTQKSKGALTTTNQYYQKKMSNEALDVPNREYFRQVYEMKTYLEEICKAKNMLGNKR
jgi:hypothetical protein